jgi:type IV pilus assembly protein PilC
MAYRYTVSTADKKIQKGVINADTEEAAETALHRAGYRVLSLREVPPAMSLERAFPTFFGVKTQDVIDLSYQLAELIESGVDILTALQLLQGQSTAAVKKVINGLIQEFQEGSLLSEALARYPRLFSYTYRQVIKASEQAGNLEAGLRQMAEYLRKRQAVKSKVTWAMAYPVMVLCLAAGVIALLVTVVLPPLIGLFSSFGAELPLPTKIVVGVGGFLIAYKLPLFFALLLVVFAVVAFVRRPSGKRAMDNLALRAPLIGPLNIERNMAHFCRTTSMLMRAGLPLTQTMTTVIETVGNGVIRHALERVKEQLVQGQGLAGPMATNPIFPQLMVGMLTVGEKASTLEPTLTTLADLYEQRADRRIETLTAMIEPALTIVIAVVVATIAFSIVTPLYSLAGSAF